jgi:hypothetical protein
MIFFLFLPHRGCVTNWYQSVITTLGLLGLMDESLQNHIWNTFKRVTLYLTSFLKSLVKNVIKEKNETFYYVCAFKKFNCVLLLNYYTFS